MEWTPYDPSWLADWVRAGGTLVLDVLTGGRIGGIEFLARL